MDKKNKTNGSELTITLNPDFKNLFFDTLYDRFISLTDTEKLIEEINTENLESVLYQTARFFYGFGNTDKT